MGLLAATGHAILTSFVHLLLKYVVRTYVYDHKYTRLARLWWTLQSPRVCPPSSSRWHSRRRGYDGCSTLERRASPRWRRRLPSVALASRYEMTTTQFSVRQCRSHASVAWCLVSCLEEFQVVCVLSSKLNQTTHSQVAVGTHAKVELQKAVKGASAPPVAVIKIPKSMAKSNGGTYRLDVSSAQLKAIHSEFVH